MYIYIYTAVCIYIKTRSWLSRVTCTPEGERWNRGKNTSLSQAPFNSPKALTNNCEQLGCLMNDYVKRSCFREETVSISILQELLSLEERLGHVNRGATQDVIEMNTLPYKYKKVSFFFLRRSGIKKLVILLCAISINWQWVLKKFPNICEFVKSENSQKL